MTTRHVSRLRGIGGGGHNLIEMARPRNWRIVTRLFELAGDQS